MSNFTGSNDIENLSESSDSDVESVKEVEKETFPSSKKRKGTHSSSNINAQKPPLPPNVSVSRQNKKKSPYWAHYDLDPSNSHVAICKYCSRLIGCDPKKGTTPLKNHVQRCLKFPSNIDRKQKLIEFEVTTIKKEDGTTECVNVPKLWEFEQESARRALARMIIVDELPFMFVEREGFRSFCKELNPRFVVPSRSTIARDCYKLFIEARKNLKDFFKQLTSRVCLTTDTWTSGQNLSYMCLTAHFIDDDWKLHKRIINFCQIPSHSGELIGKAVEKCLTTWGIKRIMTVTVDNASSNDVAIQYLKRRMNHHKTNVLNGDYLHMRCAAHILNLVVRDGLKDVDDSILKIRGAVRYVRSSPARLEKFKACAIEESLNTKSLVCLDVETRWNSTYLMLESAIKFKNAFTNLHSKDNACVRELRKCGGIPEEDDWNRVHVFLPFLKIFYDATLRLSGSRYVTANSYVFDAFGVGKMISKYCLSEDESIKNMAKQMKLKHDKYWGNVNNLNILMFIALALDPRRKMTYVDWVVKTSYNKEQSTYLMAKIQVAIKELFASYVSLSPSQSSKEKETSSSNTTTSLNSNEVGQNKVMDFEDFMTGEYKRERGDEGTGEKKNELEKFLSDECESEDKKFDILQWWKDRVKSYPILQLMARDVLAIPVSTVASESAFSTGGRVLDGFRTSLTPRMVEALICSQDWFRSSNNPLIIEETLLEIENLEEGMKDLIVEQPSLEIDESVNNYMF